MPAGSLKAKQLVVTLASLQSKVLVTSRIERLTTDAESRERDDLRDAKIHVSLIPS